MARSIMQLPDPLEAGHPEVDWRSLVGFRDVLVHDDLGVSVPRVWDSGEHRDRMEGSGSAVNDAEPSEHSAHRRPNQNARRKPTSYWRPNRRVASSVPLTCSPTFVNWL